MSHDDYDALDALMGSSPALLIPDALGGRRAGMFQVLTVLAYYADAQGRAGVSSRTVADTLALHRRTVRNILADLEARGLIARHPQRGPHGVTVWVLDYRSWPQRPDEGQES